MNNDYQQNTREQLFRAAIEVFSEHGYEAATVREICTRAGANVAAINYHFGDKKSLYTAIFDEAFASVRKHRARFLPTTAPAEQRLAAYIRSFFEELYCSEEDQREARQISAIYLMEIAHPTEVLDRIVEEYISKDAEELRDIILGLLGPGAEPMTLVNCAESVVGQVLYYYHAKPLIQRLHPDLPPVELRLEKLIQHVMQFSLAGIQSFRQKESDL